MQLLLVHVVHFRPGLPSNIPKIDVDANLDKCWIKATKEAMTEMWIRVDVAREPIGEFIMFANGGFSKPTSRGGIIKVSVFGSLGLRAAHPARLPVASYARCCKVSNMGEDSTNDVNCRVILRTAQ